MNQSENKTICGQTCLCKSQSDCEFQKVDESKFEKLNRNLTQPEVRQVESIHGMANRLYPCKNQTYDHNWNSSDDNKAARDAFKSGHSHATASLIQTLENEIALIEGNEHTVFTAIKTETLRNLLTTLKS